MTLIGSAGGVRHLLVLGGTGFVGKRLAERAEARDGTEVQSFGSRDCDLTRPDAAAALQPHIGPDTAILLCSTIARLREDSLSAFHRNVAMAESVARAVRARPCRIVVFCSSIDVYGRPPSEPVLNEESRIDPAGYYGLAKFVSERILQQHLDGSVPLAILRLPGVFALDVQDDSALGRLCMALRRNEPVTLSGGGHQVRSYLHIDELDQLVEAIVARRWTGLVNASLAHGMPIVRAVGIMRAALGSSSSVEGGAAQGTEFDIRMDSTCLRGLFPEVTAKPLELCLADAQKHAGLQQPAGASVHTRKAPAR